MKVWYECPYCGKKLAMIDDTQNISGVFIKCRNKHCNREIEIKNDIESQSSDARARDARAQKPPDDTS
ncbi:hypothetical protein [Clostridium kluyveri]|uniref:Uncharacterized protein n=1 Tax=Clostridium kluyveri TaxID=1534 RepID=A0A1L5F903_CLOKL|nr:hypothetical protein [Clostridium kluyveri]APM39443.1 hypothetical protein BS101_12155 [Clostridium kluyveri]